VICSYRASGDEPKSCANITTMKRTLKCVVFEEDGACVARCLDVEVASEGDTEEEAIANLREALELYFDSII